LPADPPLIEDVELVLIDGKPRPWFQFESDDVAADWAGGGLDAAYDHHIAEMLAIAEDRW
jgi:hypothetical protein